MTAAPKPYRLTVAQYRGMIAAGVLTEDDRIERLEGQLVPKVPRDPPHDGTIDLVRADVEPLLPAGWMLRVRQATTLADSEPEPDFAVARGDKRTYVTRHPGPADLGLVIELSDSSLATDRADEARVYARAGVPVYGIVNLVDRQIEASEGPSGPTGIPAYTSLRTYTAADVVPVALDGQAVGSVPAAELLP